MQCLVALYSFGQLRFGPDVEWILSPTGDSGAFDVDGFDYGVDPGRSKSFAEAIRRCDNPEAALQSVINWC